jgi:hypothetical protein
LVSRVIPSSQERLHRQGGDIKGSKPKKEEQEQEQAKTRKQPQAYKTKSGASVQSN